MKPFSLNNENLGAEIRKGDIDNDGDEFVISNSASKTER